MNGEGLLWQEWFRQAGRDEEWSIIVRSSIDESDACKRASDLFTTNHDPLKTDPNAALLCEHDGEYSVFTRTIGYSNVRVYYCLQCRNNMAMDTLPQNLLRRMWGELKRPDRPRGSLINVDLCFILGGPNAIDLSRLCFNSLARTCSTLRGVTVHLVNTNLECDQFEKIVEMFPNSTPHQHPCENDVCPHETELTCDWVVKNCGRNRFVVLSHFDLFFVGDFLNLLRTKIDGRTGMLGQHCPFMLLNRDAYAKSEVRFRALGPLQVVVHNNAPNECFVYHRDDPRCAGTDQVLNAGFDVGELLELELRFRGFHCDPMRYEYDKHFYHFTGGDRVRSGPEFDWMCRRVAMFEEEYDLRTDPAPLLKEIM